MGKKPSEYGPLVHGTLELAHPPGVDPQRFRVLWRTQSTDVVCDPSWFSINYVIICASLASTSVSHQYIEELSSHLYTNALQTAR